MLDARLFCFSIMAHYHVVQFLLLVLTCYFVPSWCQSEGEILVNFRNSFGNSSSLHDWNTTVNPPCDGPVANWVGVRCNDDSTIDKLILDYMGLNGIIDIDSLTKLSRLRTLSLMYNSFDGPMPPVNKLTSLKNLYLANNRFSGEIPENGFDSMNSLKEVDLGDNEFSGEIPKSLTNCPKLVKLRLDGNQFSGNIPDFPQKFVVFNVSRNQLDGEIPADLDYIDPSNFAGNSLCGKPLQKCKTSNSKKKTVIIIAVVAGTVVALLIIVAIATFVGHKKKKGQIKQARDNNAQQKFAANDMNEIQQNSDDNLENVAKRVEDGELHFVRDRDRFGLHDLLRAAAEILGSSTFGSSYKAVLLGGPAMVVKRFRQMNNVGKEEFYEHMRRLGSLSHPNLLPLVAFYDRNEEKLLVSDFVDNGSLASHLHSNRTPGEPGLDWPTRLKIIKGVAKGLDYLYKEFPNLTPPHGHLKSSNVLLDRTFEPLLTDYALVPVVTREHAQQVMVAYKSPEFTQTDRTTRKTDVWSLGIMILEMLTGKFPENYLNQGMEGNADLATWVNSVVREEWTGEVFDKDMKGTRNGEGQMLKLLKIGMCCCEWNVERRWDLREAVEKIEELKERDNENDEFSSYVSEGEIYSSRAMTDDDFSFSANG